MSRISAIMNNIHIRRKLIVSYVFVVFLPVMTVGLLLTKSLRDQSIQHAVEQSVNNVEKIKKQIEETLAVPNDVSKKIYFDKKLKRLVTTSYKSDLDVYRAYSDYTDFIDFMELYPEISGIRIYVLNKTMLENWTFFQINEELLKSDWYIEALKKRGKIGWYYIPDPTKENNNYLSLVRQLYTADLVYCGMLVIPVNPHKLQSIISQEPFYTYIVTDQNRVITSNTSSHHVKAVEQLLGSDHHLKKRAVVIKDVTVEGKPMKLIIQSLALENSDQTLSIVSQIPLETILQDAERVSMIAFFIIGGSLLLSSILIYFFSGMLSSRVQLLSQDLRKVAMGDLSLRSAIQGSDEIGQLARHINYMVESIEELIREINEAKSLQYELELKQKEIRFKMLASQVNPHFLFNVLETVRMKAYVAGEEDLANVVKSLGRILRNNLEIDQEPVSIESEIELIRMYLDIQHFRFGDKLTFTLPCAEEAQGITILPMLLQPIVENAIVHGIENKLGKGHIHLQIVRDQSTIYLVVEDDGVGIQPLRLREIVREICEVEDRLEQRIGLRNVEQRIKLYYGTEYGVQITSQVGAGTCIRIILPLQEEALNV